jgi:hypothetical protein
MQLANWNCLSPYTILYTYAADISTAKDPFPDE